MKEKILFRKLKFNKNSILNLKNIVHNKNNIKNKNNNNSKNNTNNNDNINYTTDCNNRISNTIFIKKHLLLSIFSVILLFALLVNSTLVLSTNLSISNNSQIENPGYNGVVIFRDSSNQNSENYDAFNSVNTLNTLSTDPTSIITQNLRSDLNYNFDNSNVNTGNEFGNESIINILITLNPNVYTDSEFTNYLIDIVKQNSNGNYQEINLVDFELWIIEESTGVSKRYFGELVPPIKITLPNKGLINLLLVESSTRDIVSRATIDTSSGQIWREMNSSNTTNYNEILIDKNIDNDYNYDDSLNNSNISDSNNNSLVIGDLSNQKEIDCNDLKIYSKDISLVNSPLQIYLLIQKEWVNTDFNIDDGFNNSTDLSYDGLSNYLLDDSQIERISEKITLNIKTKDKLYSLLGSLKSSSFLPQETGEISIMLNCENNLVDEKTVFIVNSEILNNLNTNDNETINYDEINAQIQKIQDSSNIESNNTVSQEPIYSRVYLKDSRKQTFSGQIKIENSREVRRTIDKKGFLGFGTTSEEVVDYVAERAEITLDGFEGFQNSKLLINDLKISDTYEFSFEKLDSKTISRNSANNVPVNAIIDSYAIDLSSLNFTNGSLTKIAKGKELYKCAEWNFETQSCLGSWKLIATLTPGQPYTIEVSAVDPGYFESGVATINTRKSIYYPNELVEIIMVVLDSKGYLVENAQVQLQIITPENNTIDFSSTNGDIQSEEKGVYTTNFPFTTISGEYIMKVISSTSEGKNEMSSSFFVSDSIDFEIIRNTPVTIDPYKDPLQSSIQINPQIIVDNYEFTELVPSDVEVIYSNGGEVIFNETINKNQIVWKNLSGNQTLNYTAQVPLKTPNIILLGKSFITYVVDGTIKTFNELREWILAIDPEVPNDDGLVVYYDRSPAGSLRYRNWTSDTLSAEISSGINVGDNPTWVELRCMEQNTLCVQVAVDGGSDLNYAVFNSNNWTWSSNTVLATNAMFAQWSYDFKCMDTSKQCLLVYENQTASNNLFMYRIWNGSSMGSEIRYNLTVAENWPYTWIKLYPKKGSDVVAIILQNQGAASGTDTGTPAIYGGIWNGTNFTNWQIFTTNSPTNGNGHTHQKHFDCAWDNNGKLLCIYGNESYNGILAYQYNGTNWSNLGNIYSNFTEPWEFMLCGTEPGSSFNHSYIGFMACDSLSDLGGGYWNGSTIVTSASSVNLTKNTNAECGANKNANNDDNINASINIHNQTFIPKRYC